VAIYFLTAVIFPDLITDGATLSKYQTPQKAIIKIGKIEWSFLTLDQSHPHLKLQTYI
jgi:hypothetical protein